MDARGIVVEQVKTDAASRSSAMGWTPQHEKEAVFIEEKIKKHRSEALMQQREMASVDKRPDDDDVRTHAKSNFQKTIKANVAAHIKRTREPERCAKPTLPGSIVYIDECEDKSEVEVAVRHAGCELTAVVGKATIVVVGDVAKPSKIVKWVAAVLGQYMCNHKYMSTAGSRGVCLKYKKALSTPRQVFATPACMVAHSVLFNRIKELVESDNDRRKRWKFLSTEGEVLKLAGKRGKEHAYEPVIWATPAEVLAKPPRWSCVKIVGTPLFFLDTIKNTMLVKSGHVRHLNDKL